MRKTFTFVGVLTVCMLVLSGVASATPKVTFKAKAVPIPGFPGTGNFLGAGAAFESEFTITGNEYLGQAPPLIGVNVYLPQGTKLHPQGFGTCSQAMLEKSGPSACPKNASAGPRGHANGYVVLGGEKIPEEVGIEPFFAPGGGLNFYVEGHQPVSIEIVSSGHFTNVRGAGGFGPEAIVTVPLVASLPGAPYATVEKIVSKVGGAYKKGKKTVYYGTIPKKCPKGGFPVKAELTFLAVEGTPQQVVSSGFKVPCPKR